MIDVLPAMVREHPDVAYIVLGATHPAHRQDYEDWTAEVRILANKQIAHYHEFIPRGDAYYKLMAVCDLIVLPSTDETQSDTLARIIALYKPFVTTAPLAGLTAQALESGGGLLFTNKQMLRANVIRLACDEQLRIKLGENVRRHLEEVVSWDVIARQYLQAYDLARTSLVTGVPVALEREL